MQAKMSQKIKKRGGLVDNARLMVATDLPWSFFILAIVPSCAEQAPDFDDTNKQNRRRHGERENGTHPLMEYVVNAFVSPGRKRGRSEIHFY